MRGMLRTWERRCPPTRTHGSPRKYSRRKKNEGRIRKDGQHAATNSNISVDLNGGLDPLHFARSFRQAYPYIEKHRNSTFVFVLPGDVNSDEQVLDGILQDVAILHGLGVRIVLAVGIGQQVDELLALRGKQSVFLDGYRVTDAAAMRGVMEASGAVRVDIEARLSVIPTVAAVRRHGGNREFLEPAVKVVSGNYIRAKRRGVVNGVDFSYAGEVRGIDVEAIRSQLGRGCIVLLSNIGYTATGEVLNCNTYEVATQTAQVLQAQKLICFTNGEELFNRLNLPAWLTLKDAQALIGQIMLEGSPEANNESTASDDGICTNDSTCHWQVQNCPLELTACVSACCDGVARSHILDGRIEGILLQEMFTRDGVGCMISADIYEGTRKASPEDVPAIEKLLLPLVENGTLLRRSRERLLSELQYFTVVERDFKIVACAALIPWGGDTAEVAAFVVSAEYRREGRGDVLLDYVEQSARAMGIRKLFLLTTRTADWFEMRGFKAAGYAHFSEEIPQERTKNVDPLRNSQLYIKRLEEATRSRPGSRIGF
eukprot:scaffold287_cov337-Pavlova_lutheri.AAC.84